jgi:hypothetical protein
MKPLPRTVEDTVEVHREEPKFGRARGELICDKRISDGAVRLYLYLHWRAGQKNTNRRARKTMAAELGISPQAIRTRAIELVYYGWLAVVERFTEEGDRTSNGYHVFENHELSKMWRDGYKDTATEKLQTFPTKYEPRKSRAGIGGRPKKNVVEAETSSEVVNSSFAPSETQVAINQLSSNPLPTTPDAEAPVDAPIAKPGSYQARTGKSDAECEAERIALAAEQRIIDERRMVLNEQAEELKLALKHYLNVGGTHAQKFVTMFQGRQSKGRNKKDDSVSAFNEQAALLKDQPVTPDEFTSACESYIKKVFGGVKKQITLSPEKLVGFILAEREPLMASLPTTNASNYGASNWKEDFWDKFDGKVGA